MFFTKTFSIKILILRRKFFFKIVLFKIEREMQNVRILRSKMNQNVIFFGAKFFWKSAS